MTTPKVKTVSVGGDRWYIDPLTGERVPGVSNIKDMLDKPGLRFGAVKATAIWTVDHIDEVRAIAATDRRAAIDLMKRSHLLTWGGKADAGTGVHAIAEALLKGEKGLKISPEQRRYIVNYARWYRDFAVKPLYVETTVWSEKYEYAGTLDSLVELTLTAEQATAIGLALPGDGPVTIKAIVDIKTGASGVWAESALQQVAYKKADYLLMPDGTRIPMPEVDATFALWLRPEGYALIPLDSSDETFAAFLGLRAAYTWHKQTEPNAVMPPLNPDAIKKRWRPE